MLGIIALISVLFDWYKPQPALTPDFARPREIQSATKIPKVDIPTEKIVAINKKAAAKKLKLPDEIAADERKQITATAEIPPYDGITDVIAVFDTETAQTEINARRRQRAFLEMMNQGAIGLRYGINTAKQNDYAADIYGRWDVLRTGKAYWGLYGEASSTGEGKAMISVEYRF